MICDCGEICLLVSEEQFNCPSCNKVYEQVSFDLPLPESLPAKMETQKGGISLRNIEITKTNIAHVPMEWLQMRYQKIERKIKNRGTIEAKLLSEKAIIEDYFKQKGCFNQIEMPIPIPKREQYAALVEKRLEEYYRLTHKQKRLKEEWDYQNRTCLPEMPRITSSTSGGSVSIGMLSKPTEQAIMKPYERMEQLEWQIERIEEQLSPMRQALDALDPPQLELVTAKYLAQTEPPNDDIVMGNLALNRSKFYEIKGVALLLIAQSLRLV